MAVLKAIIKSGVPYCANQTTAIAPSGEYEVEGNGDGLMHFKACLCGCEFTMSVDALQQHVCEGRIAVIGDEPLPQ